MFHMGLDVGSTTVKVVVLNEKNQRIYERYQRHFSDIHQTIGEIFKDCQDQVKDQPFTIAVTGSGGLSVHKDLGVDFVQEVMAGKMAIDAFIPQTDVAIELGGEDSKITYLKGSIEQRMNSICAGGTGAFIDQMASLLETDAQGLNQRAKNHTKLYPIASRCGVFAKTDIQALINQGASKDDIAASVFQSVVNQTISNLACGRPIRGKIAFLGGPLTFLDQLRERFIETLGLKEDEIIVPERGELFVATGAALASKESSTTTMDQLLYKLAHPQASQEREKQILQALFESQEELDQFRERHRSKDLAQGSLKGYHGKIYLGIDSGSTTSKVLALSQDREILFQFYGSNKGRPIDVVREQLLKIYQDKEEDAVIACAGVTGYGEDFLKAAFHLDFGEVETIAHYQAAKYYDPDVDFILDIGGQDMKSMKIEDDTISSILLNEACSSGCGSFLEAFASTVNMSPEEFAQAALLAKEPVDLGSRCTVFMNSNVKQAQKEGAEIGDIAAGLSYSVIRNAIQKVIKIRDPKDLGRHIVVQGGTFYSDAVLRAFERIAGVQVTRPGLSGLMGALGMALMAQDQGLEESSILSQEELENFSYKSRTTHCKQCSNQCALSVNIFNNGDRYISGNRCERGAGIQTEGLDLPNLYEYKYQRLFSYKPLEEGQAKRGSIGLPRVLNMYENYPFWFTFLTELGYRVVLSPESNRSLYEKGLETIPSETACYPAKLVHGHIESLIEMGLKTIFYPSVFYEKREYQDASNHLNCPVVAGYSEVIKNNMDALKEERVTFINPFLSLDAEKPLKKRLAEVFADIPKNEISRAVDKAYKERIRYHEDVKKEGQRALDFMEENQGKGIILAGRPYHVDPEINHGIAELINSLGMVVLSEDSIAQDMVLEGSLRVLDQWTYHGRLYRAAKFAGSHDQVEMVQLNSFGCGLDAVTTDQVQEILKAHHKIFTVIKIDEVNNLGAIKIRLRSLMEATKDGKHFDPDTPYVNEVVEFTKEDAKTHTILVPQMAPLHFKLLQPILKETGYNFQVLDTVTSQAVQEGLKYVNNDACYPSMYVVGQFMEAVKSGKYDTDHLTLLMSQTGGACRASNYVGFIRKALKEAGYGHVPVLAVSFQGIEKHEGFHLNSSNLLKLAPKAMNALLYGDLLMRLSNATRPYEVVKGATDRLVDQWLDRLVKKQNYWAFKRDVHDMVQDFQALEVQEVKKPRVGIVGEILVKYLPAANNFLQEKLEKEGAEVVVPDLMDFMLYSFKNTKLKADKLGKNHWAPYFTELAISHIEFMRDIIRRELEGTRFQKPVKLDQLMDYARGFVSLGHQYGEGWLLTAEMVELIQSGVENIVCVQPFGCLPNHITGKGVIKALREEYPKANIIPLDYDASASSVNQFNRIQLMLAQAEKNL